MSAIQNNLEDAFVKVSFDDEPGNSKVDDKLYNAWMDNASAKREAPLLFGVDTLKKIYPNHSIVMTEQSTILGFPGALVQPLEPSALVLNQIFVSFPRRMGGPPGALLGQVEFGAFSVAWDKYDFIVYICKYPKQMYGWPSQSYIVHEGSEVPARQLLVASGAYALQVHGEIWTLNQGYWSKDAGLWQEMQKADWKDVILDQEFKDALQKDVNGFFDHESIYRELGIPWKRGLIMYGPPGNGKTISIKAIMKRCDAKGYLPLYVKSFKSWMGEEATMKICFDKARDLAPCCLILEDLDSLINEDNRSFFLNQLDGMESNDGVLVIGTTNHLDKLDPALTSRPSRFDRKYPFNDPAKGERIQYCQYWQGKLASNKTIDFPDSLVEEVAEQTDHFSFAYLKEAFVSTLVLMATAKADGKELDFASTLRNTIKTLRKQLDKSFSAGTSMSASMTRMFAPQAQASFAPAATSVTPLPPKPDEAREDDVQTRAHHAMEIGRAFIY